MNKKIILAILILPGLSFSARATGRSEEPFPEASLTLQVAALKGPTGIGMIKLFEDKPSLGGGVSAEYTAYASPDLVVPRLIKGEIDIAALPGNLAANLYNRIAAYSLVGIIGNGVLYLVSTDPGLTSLESLRGRSVQNIAKGSTPEFVVRHILEKKGLSQDVDVQFRYSHAELAQLLIAGRQTTAILPEPFVSKVLLASPAAHIAADFQKEWAALHPEQPLYPMSVIVAKKSLFAEQPAALEKFVEACKNSRDWVAANPGLAGALAEKFDFGLSASDAEAAIPRCNLVFVEASRARRLLEEFLGVFLDFAPEAIGGKLPDEGFYRTP
jgi:NitT/TauT family transport system substrate-binding protein